MAAPCYRTKLPPWPTVRALLTLPMHFLCSDDLGGEGEVPPLASAWLGPPPPSRAAWAHKGLEWREVGLPPTRPLLSPRSRLIVGRAVYTLVLRWPHCHLEWRRPAPLALGCIRLFFSLRGPLLLPEACSCHPSSEPREGASQAGPSMVPVPQWVPTAAAALGCGCPSAPAGGSVL